MVFREVEGFKDRGIHGGLDWKVKHIPAGCH
jgi:hypothetical protein